MVCEGRAVGRCGEVNGRSDGQRIAEHVGVDDDGHVPVAGFGSGFVDGMGATERAFGSFAFVDLPFGEVVGPPRTAERPQPVPVGHPGAARDEDGYLHAPRVRVDLR